MRLLPISQIGAGGVEVSSDAGSSALGGGNTLSVTFTGVFGNVPLLTPNPDSTTVTLVTEGAAPYRKEIQAFSCSGDSAGNLVLNWRGLGEVTVDATANLATLQSAITSGLTSVTVAGDGSAICSGDLVYVTFEEVGSFHPSCATTNSITKS